MRIFRDRVGAVSPDGGNGGSGDAPAEGGGDHKRRRGRRRRIEFHEAQQDDDTRAHAAEVREVIAGRDIIEAAVAFEQAVAKPLPLEVRPILVRQWHRYRPFEADQLPAPLMAYSPRWVTRHGRYFSFRITGGSPCRFMRGVPEV